MEEDSNRKPKARKKATKHLPSELALLTDEDRLKFTLALEIDPNSKSKGFGKEFMLAQSMCKHLASADEPPVIYNLKLLVVEHLCKLCSNVGFTNCCSQSNFNSRRAIARTYFTWEDTLDAYGMKPTSHALRLTSTLCRASDAFQKQILDPFRIRRKNEGEYDWFWGTHDSSPWNLIVSGRAAKNSQFLNYQPKSNLDRDS